MNLYYYYYYLLYRFIWRFPMQSMPTDASQIEHNKRSRQNQVIVRIQVVNGRYKARELIPVPWELQTYRYICVIDTRCCFILAGQVTTTTAILFLLNHCLRYLLCITKSCKATNYIIVIHLNAYWIIWLLYWCLSFSCISSCLNRLILNVVFLKIVCL